MVMASQVIREMPLPVPMSTPLATLPLRQPYRRKRFTPARNTEEAPVFQGLLDYADVGLMKIGHFATEKHCVLNHPLNLAVHSPSYVVIKMQLQGVSEYEQGGRTMRLAPGDWGLCDAPKPCRSTHTAAAEQLHFLIPLEQVRLGIDVRFAMVRCFKASGRIAALMCQTIQSLAEELPQLDPRRASELAEVIARLFHLAVQECIGQPRAPLLPVDMRERVITFVDRQLRDPRLSLDRIAAEMGCTKRYLHMVFAGQPQTLSDYIWQRRLEHCHADLLNPAMGALSITDIAMCWGFSNLSHFSRTFRARFGHSPRAARVGHAGSASLAGN